MERGRRNRSKKRQKEEEKEEEEEEEEAIYTFIPTPTNQPTDGKALV